ncbi:Fe(3+)-hydroxamate ABC transporter permease FhuB [Starkeya sp. ORNL1]|uniref:Fe(3+)-hydroxamate ABC transporter permease FhuB n=1 Tax=Starkeya sp. ORNL1 TaxID=2709380 RepID=UPI001FEECA04|nr:Fe(3+)-hydroxamate ABC transporter permease FhuB [Starkeya sp. ORNL1]
MAEMALVRNAPLPDRATLLAAALLGLAVCLLGANAQALLPPARWPAILTFSAAVDLPSLMLRDALLPRFTVSLLTGAALGLAGVLFQQVLRNPLAEPGTLGVFAGAKCALVAATLWLPGALVLGWDVIALIGGGAATAIVLLLAARQGFAPLQVILSGLILSLSLGSLASMLMATHFDAVNDLYTWEAGSLVQNGWSVASALLLRLALAGGICALLWRRLALLDLEEDGARSLGLPLATTRLCGLLLAVALSATVAGLVGLISFIGLAGPAIARLAGARRFRDRLLAAPLLGAALLAVTDQALIRVSGGVEIPAGAVCALLGAPLLIWLVRRVRPSFDAKGTAGDAGPLGGRLLSAAAIRRRLLLALAVCAAVLALALVLGRVPEGWHLSWGEEFRALLPWRLPRAAAAGSAGLMLALAGCLLQRLTGNAIASPELIGVSSGAALLLIVMSFLLPPLDRVSTMGIAAAGAFLALMAVLRVSRRSNYAADHLVLSGVALGAVIGALVSYLAALGDPRILRVIGWLSGSTYAVTPAESVIVAGFAAAALALLPLLARWLAILPLGPGIGRELGVAEAGSRLVMILAAALLTGAATLIAGPLSFVGLMAPSLARLAGIRTPLAHAYAAAIAGASIMIAADWIGRTVVFPWQVPAGLVATVIGGAFYLALPVRR